MPGPAQVVELDGHRLKLTHPDKVVYPESGTTKAEVIAYLVEVAPAMLPHVADRICTRKRWPEGVGAPGQETEVFFEKNLPGHAPDWIRRQTIEHQGHSAVVYPVVERAADLAWFGQMNALELHVPQWTVDADGGAANPDRLVLDLDPGPGAGLAQCAEVAHEARALLADVGLDTLPVTSGSKGLHLYARLDGEHDSDYVNAFAKQVARGLEAALPHLVVSAMTKSARRGKVLVDWSQNNGNKTTIAPYSLRGTHHPFVAAPRRWDEIDDDLEQLDLHDVLDRVRDHGDLLADLVAPAASVDAAAVPRPGRRESVAVMLASAGADRAVADPGTWAYEMKWDGVRAAAVVETDGGATAVSLTTRNGNDVTDAYPEVVEALATARLGSVVLDGELVALDATGAPDFGLLQHRMGLTRPADVRRARREVAVSYLVFDLLESAGDSLRSRTWEQRREALDRLGLTDRDDAVVRVPPVHAGPLDAAVADSLDLGLEGVLAKRRDSQYRPGRSSSWVKIKHQHTHDVVIVGWTAGRGSRRDLPGALLLAARRDGELRYAGKVGSGFTHAHLTALGDLLPRFEIEESPVPGVPKEIARDARWVEPRLVAEVALSGWTHGGHVRHATWRGLREDVSPADVTADD